MLQPLLLAAILFTAPDAPDPRDVVEAAGEYRRAHGAEILQEFSFLPATPNVASDEHDIRRNAEQLAEAFRRRGVAISVHTLPGAAPIVIGELNVPGASRTIGIYAHYDGQPVDQARWTHPAWTPTLYTAAMEDGGRPRPLPRPGEPIDPEWRMYARAAGDDKAPIMALLVALDVLRHNDLSPTSNFVLLFEGEEEAGSPHLGEYFDAHRESLEADVWLICDGPIHQSRRPQLVFGVRGITSCEITVYGANRFLHSGHYGNWAPNPAMMLARLLASMTDDNGRVTIEGFYDDVEPLSAAERAALATVPDVDGELRRDFGLGAPQGRQDSLVESLLLPSLNTKGIAAGTVGPTARNVIPPTATAAIDIRLVKGNDPTRMLDLVEAHIRAQGYTIVRDEPDPRTRLDHARIARVVRGGGYRAARAPLNLPLVPLLAAAARRASGGREVILMPTMGGSLPLYLFEEKLGAPTIIVPIANHDDNQHGPDENLRLGNLWYGIDLMALILTLGATADAGSASP